MIMAVDNICFSYPSRVVLKDICFSVCNGDCVALLGTNGTGKSTMLKCLNRILSPQSGIVKIDSEDIEAVSSKKLAQSIGYTAQSQERARYTVFDAVLLGRKPYIKWDVQNSDMQIVQDILYMLGLSEYAMRYTDELSGGELQKVVIARALAQQPKILLMDEPTSNLDMKNQLDTVSVIQEIAKKQNIAVIVTMHDVNLALRFANKFILMKEGTVFAAGGREIISQYNIMQVYGVNVLIHECKGMPFIVPV